MPEFRTDGDMGAAEMDVTGASARPPRPDIEIVHRRAAEDDTEGISISLRTMPSVEAFVRASETAGLLMQALSCLWQPWFAAARLRTAVGAGVAAIERRCIAFRG
jgi:hypothetical protein